MESLRAVSLMLSLGKSTPPPQRQAGSGEAGLAMQPRTPEQQETWNQGLGNRGGRRKGWEASLEPPVLGAGCGGGRGDVCNLNSL